MNRRQRFIPSRAVKRGGESLLNRTQRSSENDVRWQYVLFLFVDVVLRTAALVPALVYYIFWGFGTRGSFSIHFLLLAYTLLMLMCTARPSRPSPTWLAIFGCVFALVLFHFVLHWPASDMVDGEQSEFIGYLSILFFVIAIWTATVTWVTRKRGRLGRKK